MHVGFNSPSSVWSAISIPATGGWQSWTTVNVPVTLAAGVQKLTLLLRQRRRQSELDFRDSVQRGAPRPRRHHRRLRVRRCRWRPGTSRSTTAAKRTRASRWTTCMAIGPRPDVVVIQEAYASLFNVYIDELQRQTGTDLARCLRHALPAWQLERQFLRDGLVPGDRHLHHLQHRRLGFHVVPVPGLLDRRRGRGCVPRVNVNGTVVQVFTTHLQTGGCANDAQSRYNSMSQAQVVGEQLLDAPDCGGRLQRRSRSDRHDVRDDARTSWTRGRSSARGAGSRRLARRRP